MEAAFFTISKEPTGSLYRDLVHFAATECTTAVVVVRDDMPLSPQGSDVLGKLRPFLETEEKTSEWPGTKLFRGFVWMYRYKCNQEFADLLSQSASGLYAWQQPDLPEDPSFLKSNGDPWLVTISHETYSYLCLDDDELIRLTQHVPEMTDLLVKDGPCE